MMFHTTILSNGKTALGIRIPPEVVAGLGTSKRPPVRVTINEHTYRSTIAVMGGEFMIGVSAANRQKAGVGAGDEVDVELELDTEPRVVTVPPQLAAALERDPGAKAAFAALSNTNQLRHALGVEGAKTAETRQRRIDKTLSTLRESPIP